MKYLILIFIQFILVQFLTAQKPALELKDCGTWPQISDEAISNDGKYVLFQIRSENSESRLYIQSVDNSYKLAIDGAKYATFTDDGSRVIFITQGDSLCILDLGTSKESFLPNITSYKIAENNGQIWLAMLQLSKDLLLYNLVSGEKKKYIGVNDYIFGSKQLLLERTHSKDSNSTTFLELINLEKSIGKIIWEGEKSSNYAFNEAGTSIAFVVESIALNQDSKYAIWFYDSGIDKSRLLLDAQDLGMKDSFYIAKNRLQFSPDGGKLFFSLKRNLQKDASESKDVGVHIWRYQDTVLTPETDYWNAEEKYRFYTAVLNLTGDKKTIRLEEKKRPYGGVQLINGGNSDYAMVVLAGNIMEASWNYSGRSDIYLINTKDGSIRNVKRHLQNPDPQISAGGKYILWYDQEERTWFTYNIENGTTKNISSHFPTSLYSENYDRAGCPNPYGYAAWLDKDESVLLYDRYDIWKVDPDGLKPPVCITDEKGRKNKIVFRYVYCKGGTYRNSPPIGRNDIIYLCAFDETNKFNGFYKTEVGSRKEPVKLSMSADVFYFPDFKDGLMRTTSMLKAQHADVYLLKRRNSVEYPNLQITRDFKAFTPLTELNPQKKFNWLTSELIKWKTFKGKDAEGILYKPENFDPQKKYPIILHFYERLSGGLNMYLEPKLSTGAMNIPFFVSQGYLVFCPDIHYTVGDPGESAYDYIVSAAKMLSAKAWVNVKHMGIQGHSWGAYQVNYLVTRTNLFAAAAAAAGNSDWISRYGSIIVGMADSHDYVENQQSRLGVTLWQNPSVYIRNSPIFLVNHVNTPLLIMHNKDDKNVPWAQGVELFTNLRRLHKKVWMLQYDQRDHIVDDYEGALDYSTRLKQFFDYYLKQKPWPEWMGKESVKGIE